MLKHSPAEAHVCTGKKQRWVAPPAWRIGMKLCDVMTEDEVRPARTFHSAAGNTAVFNRRAKFAQPVFIRQAVIVGKRDTPASCSAPSHIGCGCLPAVFRELDDLHQRQRIFPFTADLLRLIGAAVNNHNNFKTGRGQSLLT